MLHGEGVLPVFLVDFGYAFLGLGDIRHAIGADIELDGGLEKFYAFGSVDFFLHVSGLLVEISSLPALAELVTLDTLDIGLGGIVPAFGKFVVGGGLFE
jgi:hypothetical protein